MKDVGRSKDVVRLRVVVQLRVVAPWRVAVRSRGASPWRVEKAKVASVEIDARHDVASVVAVGDARRRDQIGNEPFVVQRDPFRRPVQGWQNATTT